MGREEEALLNRNAREPTQAWQPTYRLWAPSVYAGAVGGLLVASTLSPLVLPSAAGWGLGLLLRLAGSGGGGTGVMLLTLALAFVLVSVLPGLISLFLITVTDVPFSLHPILGGGFLGFASAWITQSAEGGLFGFLFGLASLGITTGLLAAARQRHRHRQRQRL